MSEDKRCDCCGKKLKTATHHHKGYQGQDYTTKGPEKHERPYDCIRYLAKLLAIKEAE